MRNGGRTVAVNSQGEAGGTSCSDQSVKSGELEIDVDVAGSRFEVKVMQLAMRKRTQSMFFKSERFSSIALQEENEISGW